MRTEEERAKNKAAKRLARQIRLGVVEVPKPAPKPKAKAKIEASVTRKVAAKKGSKNT